MPTSPWVVRGRSYDVSHDFNIPDAPAEPGPETFQQFQRLIPEIRNAIWEYALRAPKIIEVHLGPPTLERGFHKFQPVATWLNKHEVMIPSVLQVNRESRALGFALLRGPESHHVVATLGHRPETGTVNFYSLNPEADIWLLRGWWINLFYEDPAIHVAGHAPYAAMKRIMVLQQDYTDCETTKAQTIDMPRRIVTSGWAPHGFGQSPGFMEREWMVLASQVPGATCQGCDPPTRLDRSYLDQRRWWTVVEEAARERSALLRWNIDPDFNDWFETASLAFNGDTNRISAKYIWLLKDKDEQDMDAGEGAEGPEGEGDKPVARCFAERVMLGRPRRCFLLKKSQLDHAA